MIIILIDHNKGKMVGLRFEIAVDVLLARPLVQLVTTVMGSEEQFNLSLEKYFSLG